MNILQKTLGAIFPPYKYNLLRREQAQLVTAIISALPAEFSAIKCQTLTSKLLGLQDWTEFPEFKFVEVGYKGENLFQYRKLGENYKIMGLQIFSKRNHRFEDVEILIKDHLVQGIRISNSSYLAHEFELWNIKAAQVTKTDFEFTPEGLNLFYDSLPVAIKEILDPNELYEIEFDNGSFYSFYDLEDGNYLAVDESMNVYSLVHDATPIATKLEYSFLDILNDLGSGKFDAEKHLSERYSRIFS